MADFTGQQVVASFRRRQRIAQVLALASLFGAVIGLMIIWCTFLLRSPDVISESCLTAVKLAGFLWSTGVAVAIAQTIRYAELPIEPGWAAVRYGLGGCHIILNQENPKASIFHWPVLQEADLVSLAEFDVRFERNFVTRDKQSAPVRVSCSLQVRPTVEDVRFVFNQAGGSRNGDAAVHLAGLVKHYLAGILQDYAVKCGDSFDLLHPTSKRADDLHCKVGEWLWQNGFRLRSLKMNGKTVLPQSEPFRARFAYR